MSVRIRNGEICCDYNVYWISRLYVITLHSARDDTYFYIGIITKVKRWLLGIVVLVVCALGVQMVLYAQQDQIDFNETKQHIVDEVYTSTDFLPLIDIQQANVTLTDLSKSFQKLADEYYEWDEKRQELEDEYGDIQTTIEQIIADMETTKTLIIDTLTKITLFKKNINTLQEEIITLQKSLESSKEYLRLYTTFLYKINNDYYGDDLAINDIKLLVKSDNIADSLSADHLIQMLTMKLTVLLDTIRHQQVKHTKYVMELNKVKLAYQSAATVLKDDLEDLQQQKKHFYELLSYLQASRSEADQKIGLLRTSQDELTEQMVYLRSATDFGNQAEITEWSRLQQLLEIKDRDDGDRYFSWPVLPASYIKYYYHDPYYLQEYKEEFEGLSIWVEQGVEIYAPAPGIVYRVARSTDLSLNRLVIIHKHGYISFYKPLSDIFVEPGQLVQRGQIIARTGGQPGTNGAGLASSESHLVFDLMKNGESIDPYRLLDLSIFDDKEDLPEEYRMKYLQDYFAREVKLSNLPKVEGDTILERRDSFLTTYASGPYRDPSLWYDGAASTWIDPIFGICIGFAETSFKNFKTTYNIGNVGNDDSGNTVVYQSPLSGVKALYNVLNNQYLWGYYIISDLSRFGNDKGFIYASSPYNWQKNTMKCMSAIYGYSLPEDYPFRRKVHVE